MTLLGRTVRLLAEASSPTALIGGVALAVHGITRYTEDADLLSADARVLSDAFWEILRVGGDHVEVRRGDPDDPLRGFVRLSAAGEKPALLKLEAGGPQHILDVRLLLAGPEGEAIRADVEARLPALPPSLRESWAALPSS